MPLKPVSKKTKFALFCGLVVISVCALVKWYLFNTSFRTEGKT